MHNNAWQVELLQKGIRLFSNFMDDSRSPTFNYHLQKKVEDSIFGFLSKNPKYPPVAPYYDAVCTTGKEADWLESNGVCRLLSYKLSQFPLRARKEKKGVCILLDTGKGLPEPSKELKELYWVKINNEWFATSQEPSCALGQTDHWYCPHYHPEVQLALCIIPYKREVTFKNCQCTFYVRFWYPPWKHLPGTTVSDGTRNRKTTMEMSLYFETDLRQSLRVNLSAYNVAELITHTLVFPRSINHKSEGHHSLEIQNKAFNEILRTGQLSLKNRRLVDPFASPTIIVTQPTNERLQLGQLCVYALKSKLFDDSGQPLYEYLEREFVKPKASRIKNKGGKEDIVADFWNNLINNYSYPSTSLSFPSYVKQTIRGLDKDKSKSKSEEQFEEESLEVTDEMKTTKEGSGAEECQMTSIPSKKSTQRNQKSEPLYPLSIDDIALHFPSIPRSFIYRTIKNGEIKPKIHNRLEKEDVNKLQVLRERKLELKELQKKIRNLLIKQSGITPRAANAWIKRRKNRNIPLKQILIEAKRLKDKKANRERAIIDYLVNEMNVSKQEAKLKLYAELNKGKSLEDVAKEMIEEAKIKET